MRIYIPSLGRAGEVSAGPLADFDSGITQKYNVTYVVPWGQVGEYTDVLAETGALVVGVPASICGIARTRLFIGEHADDAGEDKFVMMDDDIRFLVRRDPDDWRLRGTTPDEVREMLAAIDKSLDHHAHVGVSAREGNNRIGLGGPDLAAINTRTLRLLAYGTEDFLSVEHGRVDVMEDFDVNLQLLRRGRSNCSLHYWAQGQKMTNAPGGCSTYRSHEVHEASARKLAELHPGLVRLRQKVNKTDRDGFGTRTEVTISWKKAYEEGSR